MQLKNSGKFGESPWFKYFFAEFGVLKAFSLKTVTMLDCLKYMRVREAHKRISPRIILSLMTILGPINP